MVAYAFRPPYGVAGEITRHLFSTESRAALPSNPPLAYGAAVKKIGRASCRERV